MNIRLLRCLRKLYDAVVRQMVPEPRSELSGGTEIFSNVKNDENEYVSKTRLLSLSLIFLVGP